VAGSARRWNVRVMHARLGIARRQQFMRAAVAVNTAGRLAVAALHGFAMEAAIVGCLLVGVAAGASDPFRCRLVRRTGYISVAVHAGEHAAVDGIFELLWIDMQADGLAVNVMGQRGVAMAGETFVSGWFWELLGCGTVGEPDG